MDPDLLGSGQQRASVDRKCSFSKIHRRFYLSVNSKFFKKLKKLVKYGAIKGTEDSKAEVGLILMELCVIYEGTENRLSAYEDPVR